MLHFAVDYYSLPAQPISGSKFRASLAGSNQGGKDIECPVYKKRKLEITGCQLYQQQQLNSHLIPMRWEKHLFRNQIAIYQILRKAKLLAGHVPTIELRQSPPFQRPLRAQKSETQLVKQHEIKITHQHDSTFLMEQLWSEMSELRSTSFGAVGLVAEGKGYEHWYLAFEELMEDLLEDGEDILLTIPYAEIREALAYSREILDHVEEGKLVLRGSSKKKKLFVSEACGDSATINLQFFSDAIWADPDFDVSRRDSITNSPKQILYSIHDALREITEEYYHPQVVLNDFQPRKDLIRCLADFADYLTLDKKTHPRNTS